DPFVPLVGEANDRRHNALPALLRALAGFSRRRQVAVVIVNATDKVSAGRTGPDRVDVLPYVDAAGRAVWTVEFDIETGQRTWLVSRMNLAPRPDGLAFAIDRESGRIAWDDEPIALARTWSQRDTLGR